jgi:hypothetical protein
LKWLASTMTQWTYILYESDKSSIKASNLSHAIHCKRFNTIISSFISLLFIRHVLWIQKEVNRNKVISVSKVSKTLFQIKPFQRNGIGETYLKYLQNYPRQFMLNYDSHWETFLGWWCNMLWLQTDLNAIWTLSLNLKKKFL